MQPQPVDPMILNKNTGTVFVELMSNTASAAAQNYQSLLRWLSAGTGAALALAVTWISGSHAPAHPVIANIGVCMLLVCFVPALLGELCALDLLPQANARAKGRELTGIAGGPLDIALLVRSLIEVAPRKKKIPPFGDDFAMGRWLAKRLNRIQRYTRAMVIALPCSVAVLTLAIIV